MERHRFFTVEVYSFFRNSAGNLAPPPGFSLLSPACQTWTDFLPAPLPLVGWLPTAASLNQRAPGPSNNPLRERHFFRGPWHKLSCVSRPPPHPAGAKTRRVYKQVGHKTILISDWSGSGRRRAGKSNFHPRRFRLPGPVSWSPVNGGPGARRLKTRVVSPVRNESVFLIDGPRRFSR